MIKATQGNKRKGDRDSSPKANAEEIAEAEECATKNDAPNSSLKSTGQLKDTDLSTIK
jgi:hypothetical protein